MNEVTLAAGMTMTNGKVGIIGVGLMGHGIAMNVASKGWTSGFLDHDVIIAAEFSSPVSSTLSSQGNP
jgi:3-hydroxyisobutyrate dehydrogenase-like beta-hydroxyacid dehydrogenase